MSVRLVSALIGVSAALGLSGCGGRADEPPQGGSAVGESSLSFDVEPAEPFEATSTTLGSGPDVDVNCALQAMLPWAQFVVVGDRAVVDGEVRFGGSWSVAATGARWGEGNLYQEVRAPRDGEVLPFSLPGWEAPDGEFDDRVIAFIGNALDPDAGPAVIALARTSPEFAIVGECGEEWNAAITRVAGADDPTEIAELLMTARGTPGLDQGMNATMLAIDDAQAGVPSDGLWLTQDPSVRSLSPFDIPPSERSRFVFSFVDIVFGPMELSDGPWSVRMATPEGLAFNVVISGAGGPLAAGVPNGFGAGVLEIVNPSGEVVSAIETGTEWIDPELGARLEIAAGPSDEPEVISYSPLAAGELEQLLGMSRSEIDQVRADIYAGQSSPE